ncbi:hypothetical protein ACIBH1_45225 [Nonomuraea sp. NPDC050663]|uniref:hypothetical protein n=1 Tax=Nonomuraea sp. NPDC050663 TaxID=3364370 RepID=UPI003788DCCD
MNDEPTSEYKAFAKAMADMQKAFVTVGRTFAAQGAMGWAYRGDVQGLTATLDAMDAELLTELSAAAQLLGSEADQALARKAA